VRKSKEQAKEEADPPPLAKDDKLQWGRMTGFDGEGRKFPWRRMTGLKGCGKPVEGVRG
jgi:hypothetical protein